MRWLIVALCWISLTIFAIAIAHASADPTHRLTPQAPYNCTAIRNAVEQYGVAAVVVFARARGIPERTIVEAARRCLGAR